MITFDTAVLAAAVAKAARVAPTKGSAYDKAAGILFEIPSALRSDTNAVTVKATNMEVTYLETMVPVKNEATENIVIRVPSGLLNGVLSGLPIGTTTTFKLMGNGSVLEVKCGSSKAKIRTMPESFIKFQPFDIEGLTVVPGLAGKLAQVTWACDRESIPYTGVHIDGERLVATDRYKLAVVPCEVPIDKPITVPLDVLSPILRGLSDAKVRAVDKRLHLMPDDNTQVTSVIFDVEYPDYKRVMDTKFSASLEVDGGVLKDSIQRMLVLVRGERYPLMELSIGDGKIHIFMNVEEVGEMEDEISVTKGADHEPVSINYTPVNFLNALTNTTNPEVTYQYDPEKPNAITKVDDGSGYECWVVPRQRVTASGGDDA